MQRFSRTALLAVMIGVGAVACGGSTGSSPGVAAEPQAAAPVASAATGDTAPAGDTVPASDTVPAADAATAPTTGAATGDTAPAPAVGVAPVVPPILQLKAPLIGGGEFDFAAYADKPLAIWFWAPG